MNVIEYIKREMSGVRHAIDGTMKDMTSELFNWAPPGTANSISATFIHLINVEDNIIQKIIRGKPSVWESRSWSEKTGVDKPPSIGEDWSEFKHRQIAIQPLLDYKAVVWAATDEFLTTLKPEELDRMVHFAGRERTVAEVLLMSTSQSHSHSGEIATLKGIQGVKGLPV
jgi:hypothetical protein